MGRMSVFSGKGDSPVLEWDVADAESVAAAEAVFNKVVEEGHGVVTAGPEGAVRVDKFDPQLEELYLLRPIAGG